MANRVNAWELAQAVELKRFLSYWRNVSGEIYLATSWQAWISAGGERGGAEGTAFSEILHVGNHPTWDEDVPW